MSPKGVVIFFPHLQLTLTVSGPGKAKHPMISHATFGSSVHRCCEAAGLCIHLQPFLERVDSETRMPKGALGA